MTKPIYEILESGTIKRTDADGTEWFIPNDPANSDYQRYLNPEQYEAKII